MHHKLKITTIGNSLGITLPKEVLAKLRAGKGEALYLTETPDGLLLTPYDPEFAAQVEMAESVMRAERDTLRALAEQE